MHRRRTTALLVASGTCLCCVAVALALPPFTLGPKSAPPGGGIQSEAFKLRVACHPTFDRVTITVRFATPGYDVQYVNQITADPSGQPVSLMGHAKLRFIVRPTRGHTSGGTALLPNVVYPTPHLCPNLKEVKVVGDSEGVLSFGVGLKQKKGFRIWREYYPTRLIVDIAH
jgi:hypothetical protein